MEKQLLEQFKSIDILNEEDVKFIETLLHDIFLGKKEAKIRIREFEGFYYFYTFLSRGHGNSDRFIYGKYRAENFRDALNLTTKYIIDEYINYRLPESNNKGKENVINGLLAYFDDEFKQYYLLNIQLENIVEQITDTDFYRNWILS